MLIHHADTQPVSKTVAPDLLGSIFDHLLFSADVKYSRVRTSLSFGLTGGKFSEALGNFAENDVWRFCLAWIEPARFHTSDIIALSKTVIFGNAERNDTK